MLKAEERANTPYIILISCAATIGGFLFGFDSGVINGTIEGLQGAFDSDSVGTGFNVASMLLGCAFGAFFAGRMADRMGRRAIMRVAAVLFIISAWGSGIASESAEFVFYRILGGFAVGAASVLAPAYISEVAPARYRGSLATVQQIAIISGLFVAFFSNYLIAGAAGGSTEILWFSFEAWRWMFWVPQPRCFDPTLARTLEAHLHGDGRCGFHDASPSNSVAMAAMPTGLSSIFNSSVVAS